MDNKTTIDNIRYELESYITENKIQSLILGISGGIDSALCAALASSVCSKLQIPLIGRSIPISTNTLDEIERSDSIGNSFCDNYDEVTNILSIYNDIWPILHSESWGIKENFRKGNLKARLRMIYLYDLAQAKNGMVLSTDNYTEYLLGFWTLHGDVGDFGMIQELWKTEVYELSEWLITNELDEEKGKSLQQCVDCQATDGLGISLTDLDQILPEWQGTSKDGYAEVDKRLKQYINYGIGDLDDKVIHRHISSMFKRNNPFNIKRQKIYGDGRISMS